MAALDQHAVLPGNLLRDGVVLGSLVATDVDDVAVAPGGDHPGGRTSALEHRVGGDGGPVQDVIDGWARDAVRPAQSLDSLQHADRRVLGGRRQLVDAGRAGVGVGVDHVREGTTDVDADQLHDRGRYRAISGRAASARSPRSPGC